MKATLGVEFFGYDGKCFKPGFIRKRPWVAEIVGIDEKWGYRRSFLNGDLDFTHASSTGKRGVYLWFLLEEGKVYQVEHFTSWRNQRRYFCTPKEGRVIEIAEQHVIDYCNGLSTIDFVELKKANRVYIKPEEINLNLDLEQGSFFCFESQEEITAWIEV